MAITIKQQRQQLGRHVPGPRAAVTSVLAATHGMNNILDHIASTPVLDVVGDWPRSTTRTEWFCLTRDLI